MSVEGGADTRFRAAAFATISVFRIEFLVMAFGLALVVFTLYLPAEPEPKCDTTASARGFDGLGALLLFTTIALPLFALNTGGSILPWGHPLVVALLTCTPLAAAACYWSQTRSKIASPLLPVKAFRNRSVIAVMTCVFFLVYSFNAVR